MDWNKLGSYYEGFTVFAAGLKDNESLLKLDLRCNEITLPLVKSLVHMGLRGNMALKTLDLRWNSLGDQGGREILELLNINHSLEYILLEGNDLMDETSRMISNTMAQDDV